MVKSPRNKSVKSGKAAPVADPRREARLAAALRENLRRRKAPGDARERDGDTSSAPGRKV